MKTYTLNDITPKERTRLGDVEAQKIVDEWNAFEAQRPTMEWLQKMKISDATMTRHTEDILDKISVAGMPQAVVDAYNAKKALRAAKPT